MGILDRRVDLAHPPNQFFLLTSPIITNVKQKLNTKKRSKKHQFSLVDIKTSSRIRQPREPAFQSSLESIAHVCNLTNLHHRRGCFCHREAAMIFELLLNRREQLGWMDGWQWHIITCQPGGHESIGKSPPYTRLIIAMRSGTKVITWRAWKFKNSNNNAE